MKHEPFDIKVDTNDEVAVLKDLLERKSVEMSRREVETNTLTRKLTKEKECLKAENRSLKVVIERLKQKLRETKNIASEVKTEPRAAFDVSPIVIGDDSEEENNVAGSGNSQRGADHPPSPRNAPPVTHSPSIARDTSPLDDRPPDIVEVNVKVEGYDDEFKYVSFVKSEDGLLDIWNLEGFDLGPPITVDEKYNRGFSRKVISDAFGGGHQSCFHNWGGANSRLRPLLTFNRSWNPPMPNGPGQHGVVFCAFHKFNDGSKVNQPIPFFVGEGRNDWRFYGDYSVKRWGEISPAHLHRLPPTVLSLWIHGALKTEWGKSWVNTSNDALSKRAEETGTDAVLIVYSETGLTEALHDGRLIVNFTIMKCVSYQSDKYKRLVYFERHPKPVGKGSSTKKRARVPRRGNEQLDTSSEESDDESSGKRKKGRNQISTPAKRAKGQKGQAIKEEARVSDGGSELEYVEDSELEEG